MLISIFCAALFLGVYPYVVYPVLVRILAAYRVRPVHKDSSSTPFVTVVTAAFNEARHIEATVLNKLALDYPADRIEVIVVSDGSEDGTDALVNAIAARDPRVRLIRQSPRAGKTSGLNLAIPHARGDILVFADANSIYRADALRQLVRNFADAEVGYVTGQMLYVNSDGSLVGDGCSAYMRYENLLRAAETRIGSIVGVDGGVDSVRRSLYRPMRPDQLPDFVLPLSVVEQGYRVVYEPAAVLNEETLATGSAEYRMRVRVALRSFWALWDKRALFNPFRYGLFSWQLLSHKLLRYLSFVPLTVAAVAVWFLEPTLFSRLAQLGALAFALLIALALVGPRSLADSALARYCYYFFLLNWSSAVAFGKFLAGKKQVLWQPRVG
jgi:cellulose synthase/poly-beta-1,6-N-acetylglucosamine synthase-like glycosyltransferase